MVPPVSDRENKNSFDFNTLTLAQQRACVEEFRDAFNVGVPDHMRMVHAQSPEAFGPGAKYRVYPLNDTALAKLREDENLYYCVGAVTPYEYEDTGNKDWRRRVEDIGAGVVVGFDDIGTKTMKKCGKGLDFFEQTLPPTAVIETSPGNFQLLYFLAAPILDSHDYGDVLRSIIKPLSERYGIDKLADVNRVLRLPFGINNKTLEDGSLKYPDKDGNPWRVRLVYADYDVRYSPEEIAAAYGLTIERTPRKSEVVRRVAGREEDPYKAAGFDLIADAYTKADRAWPTRTEAGRKYRICCPFEGEHASGGMNDDAFIADPAASKNGYFTFGCSHGSCNGDSEAYAAGRRTFAAAMEAAGVSQAAHKAAMMVDRAASNELVRELNEAALWADGMTVNEWIEILKANAEIESGGDLNMSDGDAARESAQSKLGAQDDATPTGNSIFPTADERPCCRVYEKPFEIKKRKYPAGLYLHGVKYDKDNNATNFNIYLCSPLRILAETRNRNDAEYGILIEFKTEKGWKKWCVPAAMLVGDATDAKRELARHGLKINPDAEKELVKYFRLFSSTQKLFSASTTGWDGSASFVLPERVIGGTDIYFQSRSVVAPYGSGGSLEGWRGMAALARGNPLLMLGISASFAGPLLKHLHVSGAGLHFFGDSSTGKSTIARAAVATWGSANFMRTWNATANGLEGAAVTHTDTLLALDEMGQARDMRDVYEAAYALINGSGRSRAQQNGDVRESKSWRVFLMSNGEGTMSALLDEGDLRAKAGQQVRLLDIPASRKYGAFDDLHGRSSGAAFSDEVSRLAAENFGWAGVAFVERLIADLATGVKLGERLDAMVDKFGAQDGQERRVARAFAMCAMAGEMATGYGILPWTDGDALAAALASFKAWKSYRPSSKLSNSEDAQILQSVLDGIERFEDTKFSDIRYGELRELEVMEGDQKVIKSVAHRVSGDRYGYWEAIKDEMPVDETDTAEGLEMFDEGNVRRRYFLTASGLGALTKGFDNRRVIKALDAAGALFDREKSKAAKVKKVPGKGGVRMYFIDLEKVREALSE
ncbi:DUF927 domain-containing protein [Burkholderia sp. MSMB2157WGS]|nr:DUF927 domain-containing protein [Burkholderia sp. MSMB2157WGS]KWE57492.1 hypothetical protein WT53_16385 [Burkholderia sp. MSMB2157WGS]